MQTKPTEGRCVTGTRRKHSNKRSSGKERTFIEAEVEGTREGLEAEAEGTTERLEAVVVGRSTGGGKSEC